ncbi:hypothetical protein MTR_4g129300 [Medicago truncatula]|uniref:Uncharacterized protein n=2 Tax=Medicago truncatula TaxID=3880 RepID=G7JEA3_MEDTR|nr:hypothetical protein MTR_4g129300 [Medicago truncatula]
MASSSSIIPLTNAQFASFHTNHSFLTIAKVLSSDEIVSSGKDGSKKDVIMVDPIEAKRLVAKQMERIKEKEKLEKRHQIEATNGAWAMIGLTVGLAIEGQTG